MEKIQPKRNKPEKLIGLIFASLFIFISNIAFAEIAVIVHPENSSSLDKKAIKKIFMGKTKKFANGNVILPMNASKGAPSRDNFNELAIGRTTAQVNAYWSKLVFTGKGTMPRELTSDAEIIATVSANKGAISYVDASAVTDAVKVIATY
ncbi:substrate-binding domain-containing protein [Thalassomonas haliotis]|uniref:Substrate-binding domain-containing protein n=1 Tax=Thalassomonas haliotis TaxID=485448 RepID=A0ABY7VHQ2_9GAMM|nr:substrate-binding domain-containing protein [Thalassomonas haliotis]WDE13081.1 substrate-binding domain-containing protein [Thalassomonas haliotis]